MFTIFSEMARINNMMKQGAKTRMTDEEFFALEIAK